MVTAGTVGTNTVAIGSQAGQTNLGTDSIAIGYNTSVTRLGIQSTAVGSYSGYNQTGSYNTFIGRDAGYDAQAQRTGSNNTYIGYAAQANASNYSNSTAIGTGAVITASNQIKLGTTNETVSIPGKLAIGTSTTPLISLNIVGTNNGIGRMRNTGFSHDTDKIDGLYIGRWDGTLGVPYGSGATGEFCGMATRVLLGSSVGEPYSNQAIISFYVWGNNISNSYEGFRITQRGACLNSANSYGGLSDERIKENISTSKMYLSELKKIRIVKYSLKSDKRSNADKLGVIAQEVKEIFPGMVDCQEYGEYTDLLSVKSSVFVPMLITAVQELSTTIETQQTMIQSLEARLSALENK